MVIEGRMGKRCSENDNYEACSPINGIKRRKGMGQL